MLSKIKTNKNYVFKKNKNVKNISYDFERNLYKINYNSKNSAHDVYSKFIICALPRKDLIKFDILSPFMSDLNSINEIAKMRIFEIYDTKTREAWFKDLPKLSTNEELQFVQTLEHILRIQWYCKAHNLKLINIPVRVTS